MVSRFDFCRAVEVNKNKFNQHFLANYKTQSNIGSTSEIFPDGEFQMNNSVSMISKNPV